jgi:O-methyltransferase involved in polyketide biosynthesis
LAEGLLGYLEEPKVHRLFEALDPLAASGSFLLTDVSGQSALNEPSFNFWLQRMATNGIIGGRFGADDPAALLAAHGWGARGQRVRRPGRQLRALAVAAGRSQ